MCGCIHFIMKYVLFIVNLIFFIIGAALTIIGIVVLVQLGDVGDILMGFQFIPIWIVSLGAIIFFISFFGCCGAAKESKCMLYFYSALMLVLIAVKIYVATEIFRHLNDVQNWVITSLSRFFAENQQNFGVVHTVFRCCGTTGYEVFLGDIPPTCCAQPPCTPDNAFDGCNTVVTDYFDSFGAIIGTFVIVAICVEFIAVLFAVFIATKRNRNKGMVY